MYKISKWDEIYDKVEQKRSILVEGLCDDKLKLNTDCVTDGADNTKYKFLINFKRKATEAAQEGK